MRFIVALLATILPLALTGTAQAQETANADTTLIFFAWDRPIIDRDAAAQLEKLAIALRATPAAALELAGHTDRSGPAASNLRSGRARAEAVRAFLASRGVPVAAMTVVSHGEARPLIATADGVREPQNRRVEISVGRPSGN